MARESRRRGRITGRIAGVLDFLGDVVDIAPLFRIVGHILILPIRLLIHLLD